MDVGHVHATTTAPEIGLSTEIDQEPLTRPLFLAPVLSTEDQLIGAASTSGIAPNVHHGCIEAPDARNGPTFLVSTASAGSSGTESPFTSDWLTFGVVTAPSAVNFSWMPVASCKQDGSVCPLRSYLQMFTVKSLQILQNDSFGTLEVPMVGLEGSSRGHAHGTVKGWKVMKAGMEKILGRSIIPERDSKLAQISGGASVRNYLDGLACKATLDNKDCIESLSKDRLVAVENDKGRKAMNGGMEEVLGRFIVKTSPRISQLAVVDPTASGGNVVGFVSSAALSKKDGMEPYLAEKLVTTKEDNASKDELISTVTSKSGKAELHFLLSQDKALAGALAGTCVSLCLHPVDTVKTVIQAQSSGQRSVLKTLMRLISDRGLFGMYKGLGSNLAASAPISAIYTFTYESVKSALLPHLPKNYHALVHCAAGGCASVATSIVYTPSECVKQRMQVGCAYRNSWHAFLGIIQNGGLPVLYSGWGAVLWRNVPQSIIKFYMYEGLKQNALSGLTAGSQLYTWQTLLFGGLAGSTAALFTTPFDVVKTRLQTQVASSLTQQKGVLQVFKQIAMSEGIGGLYRGLVPRLVIYVSQGALFFASYEFFKYVLAIELKRVLFHPGQNSCLIGHSNRIES